MAVVCPVCGDNLEEAATPCTSCSNIGAAAEGPPSPATHLSSPMFETDPPQRGIGGWLILVALGLVLVPFMLLHAMWEDVGSLMSANRALVDLRIPGLSALIVFVLFVNSILLLGLVALIVPFFREQRRFPRLYQLWLGFSLVARLAEYTLSYRIGAQSGWEGAPQVIEDLHAKLGAAAWQAALAAIVWIAYFETSRRVKATFVN